MDSALASAPPSVCIHHQRRRQSGETDRTPEKGHMYLERLVRHCTRSPQASAAILVPSRKCNGSTWYLDLTVGCLHSNIRCSIHMETDRVHQEATSSAAGV